MSQRSRQRRLSVGLSAEMCELLATLARDIKAPTTARVAAARAVIDYERDQGAKPGDDRPATDMSLEELDEAIAAHSKPP